MEALLIAIAAFLTGLGTAFVVWVYRTDKRLQRLCHDRQHKHYTQTLRTKEKEY